MSACALIQFGHTLACTNSHSHTRTHTLTHSHSELERDSNNLLFGWSFLLQWISAAMPENVTTIQLNWDVVGQRWADNVLWLVILSCLEVSTITTTLWDILNMSSVCLDVLYLFHDVRHRHRTVLRPGRPWKHWFAIWTDNLSRYCINQHVNLFCAFSMLYKQVEFKTYLSC